MAYSGEQAKIAPSNCGCFWLNGVSFNGAATLFKRLGIAAILTGEHAYNIIPEVNLGKVSVMAGPRYTCNSSRFTGRPTKTHGTLVFGKWLFGGVHAFDSTFPSTSGVNSKTNSFSTQLGAGADVAVIKGFGVRAT